MEKQTDATKCIISPASRSIWQACLVEPPQLADDLMESSRGFQSMRLLEGWGRKRGTVPQSITHVGSAILQVDVVTRKQTVKSLSLSYAKKDWRAGAPPILLWVWHRLQNIIYEGRRVMFYSRCHTQRRIGGATESIFGMPTTKTLRSAFSWRVSGYFSLFTGWVGEAEPSIRSDQSTWTRIRCKSYLNQ